MTQPERACSAATRRWPWPHVTAASPWAPATPAPRPRKSSNTSPTWVAAGNGPPTKRSPWRSPSARPSAASRALADHEARRPERGGRLLFTAAYIGVAGALGDRLGRRSRHGLQPERAGQPPLRRGGVGAHARAGRLAGGLRLHAGGRRAFRPAGSCRSCCG